MPEAYPLFAIYSSIGIALTSVLAVHVIVLQRRVRTASGAARAADAARRDALTLAESQARYRALFDSSPLSLWEEDFSQARRTIDEIKESGVTDLRVHLTENPDELERVLAGIRVIDVNQQTLRLYGAADKSTFLAGLSPLVHPDARPVLAEEFAALADGATLFRGELPSYAADGQVIDLDVTVAVVPGAETALERVLVTCVDVTERNEIQRRLATRGQELEELVRQRTDELWRVNAELLDAVRAQEQFLSNVRHEMRTPLNSMIGFTSIVSQGMAGPIPEEATRQLDMANRSGRQLLALVNNVLELNEVRSGEIRLEYAPLDLDGFLGDTCETVRSIAEAEGLGLRCEWDPLPKIETDATRLEQVVLALLSNALKFTESGEISLTASHTETHIEIVVADTGPGIEPEDRERIFDAFHQLQPVRGAKHAGTGLGLAIARELTLALGGELSVESEPGEGSRFVVRIPISPFSLRQAG